MIRYFDEKITANEYAKLMVTEYGVNSAYLISEYRTDEWEAMSEREREEVNRCIAKQVDRIEEFLNIRKIRKKIYSI